MDLIHRTIKSLTLLLYLLLITRTSLGQQRQFEIDWTNNVFLKDGQAFQYISGSLHYFRIPVEYWSDRMIKMRSAGLNAVQTYVEWRSHEPSIGNYNFNGNLDLFKFIETAQKHDLLVILRPGPYICAERDMGGLPSWLLTEDPSMTLRSNDSRYLDHVIRWFNHLLPKLNPYLYKNGGPVIMMQVENEYGSYSVCDFQYTSTLRDLMANLTNNGVILFTTDGNGLNYLKCGLINGTFGTIDFGPGTDVAQSFSYLRSRQPNGPLVNSEYYTGWLDHWSQPHQVTSSELVAKTLDTMLSMNISINMYMFNGGTNFDLGAGANGDASGTFQPQPTSYDYDAPLTESGDLTDKYLAIRSTIAKYFPVGDIPEPRVQPKMALTITAARFLALDKIVKFAESRKSFKPMTFESLGVSTGFVIYTSLINCTPSDPVLLNIETLRDRATVYVDGVYQGVLSRAVEINQLPIEAHLGSQLTIIVENEGRMSYGDLINQEKGIIGDVKLGSMVITNWTNIYFPEMSNFLVSATNLIKKNDNYENVTSTTKVSPFPDPLSYPALFQSSFQLPIGVKPADTFMNMYNFTKGVAMLNGHLLGKYWPHTGPQVTLFVPGVWFKSNPDYNELFIWETLGTTSTSDNKDNLVTIQFQQQPILNGSIPFSTVSTLTSDYWLSKLQDQNIINQTIETIF